MACKGLLLFVDNLKSVVEMLKVRIRGYKIRKSKRIEEAEQEK